MTLAHACAGSRPRAKGVDPSAVSLRLKFYTLPQTVKKEVVTGNLSEGHLQAITSLVVTSQLTPWLTTEQAWDLPTRARGAGGISFNTAPKKALAHACAGSRRFRVTK